MLVDMINLRHPGLGNLNILSCCYVGNDEYNLYMIKSVIICEWLWLLLFLRTGSKYYP